MDAEKNVTKHSPLKVIFNAFIWFLCVILAIMLICNITIIIKGSINPDTPPDIFGVVPMVVLTDSMSGDAEDHIEAGDLIFIKHIDPEKLKIGDVICFMEDDYTVTHRIIAIEEYRGSNEKHKGQDVFVTKGDFNNTEDKLRVPKSEVIGIYSGVRFAGIGEFVLFLQKPIGMLIFIGVPVLIFIFYDILRRKLSSHKQEGKTAELEAEIEKLRALAGEIKSENSEERED